MSDKLRQQRYRANCELLDTLKALISDDSGNQRFSQILINFGFVYQVKENVKPDNEAYGYKTSWKDEYYLEPNVLLERVKTECIKVLEVNCR